MNMDDQVARVVEARMKLRARFLRDVEATPSIADDRPMGSGTTNRHGMPRLPPGQYETTKWPVLNISGHPSVTTERWRLHVVGAVSSPLVLTWSHYIDGFEQVDDTSDFHCVTKWSRMDTHWGGVRLGDVIAAAEPADAARFVLCHAFDGYTTNLPLAEALKADVLLVHTVNGQPLPVEHGGPCRVITPQLYAWKGAKWISKIEVLERDQAGFWEQRGYSNTAYPWRNDRYSR
jgi:DMSO/TMAO reductase YedYZ molybdopterin-dependent catalytic subunit